MKIFQGLQVLLFAIVMLGLSGFIGDSRGPVTATEGTGYKIHAEEHLNMLMQDYKSGKISKAQYDIGKDRIENGSLLK